MQSNPVLVLHCTYYHVIAEYEHGGITQLEGNDTAALIMLACCQKPTRHIAFTYSGHTTPHGDARTNHHSTIAATPRRRLGTQFTR